MSDYRWYLRQGELRVGPFASMTRAFRHRRDHGPASADIELVFWTYDGVLFPPISPERHIFESVTQPEPNGSPPRAGTRALRSTPD